MISWSLHWMCQGKWPDRDHKGKKYAASSAEGQLAGSSLAGGFFAVLWNIKGDLKFFSGSLGMRCCTGLLPCDFCGCHRIIGGDPSMHQLNFARRARWKSTLVSPLVWKGMNPGRHLIFQDPWESISQHNCASDELHISYMGVYQVLLGSILWLLCYRVLVGTA